MCVYLLEITSSKEYDLRYQNKISDNLNRKKMFSQTILGNFQGETLRNTKVDLNERWVPFSQER